MLDSSPENDREGSAPPSIKTPAPASDKFYSSSYPNHKGDNGVYNGKDGALVYTPTKISNLKRRGKILKDLSIVIDLSLFFGTLSCKRSCGERKSVGRHLKLRYGHIF